MKASANPFATGRLERLLAFDPTLIGTSWEAIDARWRELGGHACVVGRRGSGKTTLLDAIAERMGGDGKVVRMFFNDQNRRVSPHEWDVLAELDEVNLLVDGDENLGWRERRRLVACSKKARRSLFARHRASGMPKLMCLSVDLKLAKLLLDRILPGSVAISESELRLALDAAGGNLRELWLSYYDLAAQKAAIDPG